MRCPVCKADNLQTSPCRRCKADLSLLFALEQQRKRIVAETRDRLRRGDWRSAVRHAEAAHWLRRDEESRRLIAVAQLLAGDFTAAWRAYRQTSEV